MRPLLLALAFLPVPAAAQDILASYAAVIGLEDLYNSEGTRLTEPWQVLRQDRANYHRFGIRQEGDGGDPLFADASARERMERLIRSGGLDPEAARAIVEGGVPVWVTVHGKAGVPEWIDVEVLR